MTRKTLIVIIALLLGILVSGCMTAPEQTTSSAQNTTTEPALQSKDRYVEISFLDGTAVGGKYVSETAAFTTVLVMYVRNPDAYVFDVNGKKYKDPDNYLRKANGAEISFKNSLINTMVTIDEPTAMIDATLQELNESATAIKEAADEKEEAYRIAKEKREAAQAK